MKPVPRMGLLLATLTLPLGAVLASHVVDERSAPVAPAGVRVGESHDGAEIGVGQPAAPPSPAAVRPLVVGERATPTSPTPAPGGPADPATPGPAVPAAPPGAEPADPGDPANSARENAKGKARGHSVSVPAPGHPTPNRGVTPGANGTGG